jgi:cytochrome c1
MRAAPSALPAPWRSSILLTLVTAAALLGGAACSGKPDAQPAPAESAAPAATASASAAAVAADEDDGPEQGPPGDAAHGKALVHEFQCARCHDGTGEPAVKQEQQCFRCHQEIMTGAFKAPTKDLQARWENLVSPLRDAPTLTSTTKRFKRRWLEKFLLDPYDLRPHLAANMPRLALTTAQAKDLAAYLGAPDAKADAALLAGASADNGRKLIEAKGCPTCHVFTGVAPLEGTPAKVDMKTALPAVSLAPDFRSTRRRMTAAAIVAWITSPKAMKPDTAMPELPLRDAEIKDIARYITTAKLAPEPPKKAPDRLPLLERKVGFDEVAERIFRRSCWHCHGEPDYAVGDGGPGNTGGFGFKPRGLALTNYEGVASGYTDDKGERHSVFEKLADGTPRLLAAVLARHDEEAGHPRAEVRGMPLGYPALAPEDVQLLATWIDQGRPR